MAGSRLQPSGRRAPPRRVSGRRRRLAGDLTELPGVGPYTAAAIANFAFDENVLPRDVNVDRVERRTGHGFTGAAAQALMDLGATVCLARIPRCDDCPLLGACPSRGTRDEAARKQSRFEGSFRQRRATALRSRTPHSGPACSIRRWSKRSSATGSSSSRTASSVFHVTR